MNPDPTRDPHETCDPTRPDSDDERRQPGSADTTASPPPDDRPGGRTGPSLGPGGEPATGGQRASTTRLDRGGRHPLSIRYLVAGLVFLGVATSWALRETGVVGAGQQLVALPADAGRRGGHRARRLRRLVARRP